MYSSFQFHFNSTSNNTHNHGSAGGSSISNNNINVIPSRPPPPPLSLPPRVISSSKSSPTQSHQLLLHASPDATMTPQSPHDSAISVTTKSSRKRERSHSPHEETSTAKRSSNSPRLVPSAFTDLPLEQQAIIQAENDQAVNQAQLGIEIDDSSSDAGYETDSLASASTSLASGVRDYAFENGRRYHKFREGTYNFPNDDSEQDREDMKHAMMVNLLGQRLHFAPIGDNPQNVLDMGTGTGIWAIEMGDLYPGANILGVDLSPIQPEWVPPNVKFMVDDVESPWLKPPNYFDYVHARHTVMAIRNWPLLMQRVFTHLKPGGWLELQEIHHYPQCHDGSMPENHPVAQYWGLIIKALGVLGVNFNAALLLEDMMRQVGFVNISVRIFHIPIGTWAKNRVLKQVGLYWRTILIDGLQPIALGPMTRGLKWTKEQVEVWLIEVRKAYMEGWVHSHMPLYIICGQKPEGGVRYSENT